MSRRRAAEKRTILPDHKFKDLVLAKFMNRIMVDGKKSISEKIVYGAFDLVSKKTDKEPIDFFPSTIILFMNLAKTKSLNLWSGSMILFSAALLLDIKFTLAF